MTLSEALGQQALVESSAHRLSAADLAADTLALRAQVELGGRAYLQTHDAAVVAAALVALDGWAAEVHLLVDGLTAVDTSGMSLVAPAPSSALVAGSEPKHDEPGLQLVEVEFVTRWVVYTSGTTGEPKPIRHTIDSLTRTVVVSEAATNLTWGLLYDPNRMAGLQVLLQSLLSGATVIAADSSAALSARIDRLREGGVTALSATPTLWRQILQARADQSWPLTQVTLGGEIADQPVLDALKKAFPEARIVHVFASTETGAAFSISDGRSGFPTSYLLDPPRGISLEIRESILHVFSPGVSAADADGFASTGDIVELVGDRVVFKGRNTGAVNIGGTNVWPEEVETLLRTHPAVQDVLVVSKENSMVGNVLVASVVVAESGQAEGLKKRLRSWVRDRAPSTHVPATIKVVDQLEVSSTGKAMR